MNIFKYIFTSTLFLFPLFYLHSQTQFQLAIGNYVDDVAHCIITTSDGGYAVAGYKGPATFDVYVIKLDRFGIPEWTKIIGGPNRDEAYSIVQTFDGGYFVGAYTSSFQYQNNIYLIKLDSTGTIQWEKVISGYQNGPSNDFLNTVIQTSDSGFAVSAGTSNINAIPPYGGVQLFKLDQNGNILWNKVYNMTGSRYLIQSSDGGFALGGTTSSSVSILKLDSDGNVQWGRTVGGVPTDAANSIIQTADGGYALAGRTVSYGSAAGNMYIVKLDSAGSLDWTRYVGGSSEEVATDIIQTSDGGYAVSGYTRTYGSGNRFNMYLVKLDAAGEVEWSRSVGTSDLNEFGNSIKQTSDGGYIIAGYNSSGLWPQIFIVKFDEDGNTCANMSSPLSENGTGGMINSHSPATLIPGYIEIPASGVVSSGVILTAVCEVIPVELLSFTLSVNGNNVTLSWVTASEVNNSGFEIEKQVGSGQSAVGNWEMIGFVEGNGTTTETNYYSFEDRNLSSGNYQYRLKQIDFDGSFEYSEIIEVEIDVPNTFSLLQNYPNPFNPSTVIGYSIPADGFVSLTIYNAIGQEVSTLVNENQPAGKYSVNFSAEILPSGLYFYTLRSGDYKKTRKMLLLK